MAKKTKNKKSILKNVNLVKKQVKKSARDAGKRAKRQIRKINKKKARSFFTTLKNVLIKNKRSFFFILFLSIIFIGTMSYLRYEIRGLSLQCRNEIKNQSLKQEAWNLFKSLEKDIPNNQDERKSNWEVKQDYDLSSVVFEKKVPMLMYHYIDEDDPTQNALRRDLTVSPVNFEEQMKWLVEKGYKTMTMSEYFSAVAYNKLGEEKVALLTFDDGYRDFYEKAFPILKKYNQKATMFVITDSVGLPSYMTWDQIRELSKEGVEFGSHSLTHPNLTQQKDDKLKQELTESKIKIEDQISAPVNFFCYPYGFYDSRVKDFTKEAGYKGAVATYNALTINNNNLFEMPRYRIFKNMAIDGFAWTVGQFYQ